MNDIDVHGLAAVYVLGALDGAERQRFEDHLLTCAQCRLEVDDLSHVTTALADSQATLPPPDLKARVMGEVRQTSQEQAPEAPALAPVVHLRRARWLAVAASAAAAVALVVAGLAYRSRTEQNDSFAAGLASLMRQPDAQMLRLEEQQGSTGQFKVAWSNAAHRAALIGEGLAPAPSGKAYELWLITPQQTMAMRVLDPAPSGRIDAVFAVPQTPVKWAITVEPVEGVDVATGAVIFIASV